MHEQILSVLAASILTPGNPSQNTRNSFSKTTGLRRHCPSSNREHQLFRIRRFYPSKDKRLSPSVNSIEPSECCGRQWGRPSASQKKPRCA
jgi:hypothetical protein